MYVRKITHINNTTALLPHNERLTMTAAIDVHCTEYSRNHNPVETTTQRDIFYNLKNTQTAHHHHENQERQLTGDDAGGFLHVRALNLRSTDGVFTTVCRPVATVAAATTATFVAGRGAADVAVVVFNPRETVAAHQPYSKNVSNTDKHRVIGENTIL